MCKGAQSSIASNRFQSCQKILIIQVILLLPNKDTVTRRWAFGRKYGDRPQDNGDNTNLDYNRTLGW